MTCVCHVTCVYIYIHTLHYIALHSISFHSIPLHCIALHYITLHTYIYIFIIMYTLVYTLYVYIVYKYAHTYIETERKKPPMPSSCQANELLQGLRGIARWLPIICHNGRKKNFTILYYTDWTIICMYIYIIYYIILYYIILYYITLHYIILYYIYICVDPEWYEHNEHTIFEVPSDVDQRGLACSSTSFLGA